MYLHEEMPSNVVFIASQGTLENNKILALLDAKIQYLDPKMIV